ncbi:hypothetical protein MKL09_25205 [Methylobacterium sp. J-048]|uniref:PD-(D/E)XK nuclease domain-containing protein n=1 Tax=Methylobacterium sp. J-048 TaxID=2836635 RepID=UPI001FBAD7B2|nr:hypothetical protein [Methylobacterium sp. J-048]MCJ2059815.1 hypothetical protein [Methylobacterium sp. J-048]
MTSDAPLSREAVRVLRGLSARVGALRRAMEAVMAGTTPDHAKWVAFKSYAKSYNEMAALYITTTKDPTPTMYNLEKIKSSMDTLWPVQKEIFDMIYVDVLTMDALLIQFDTGKTASLSELQDLLSANLRKVIFARPDREVEIQNAIETLLVGRGYQKAVDYDRETGKFKFSGKEFIPDFIFPTVGTALEVKLIRERAHVSKCIEEMSADIPAYLSKYADILFCVYDLGEIRDVNEFQEGIAKQPGVRICVVKH